MKTQLKDKLIAFLSESHNEYLDAIKKSFILSAEYGHEIHHNHPEMSDDKNFCLLNKGILLKFSSIMDYTSDAFTSAFVKTLYKANNIPYQVFFNRSDVRGGSTLVIFLYHKKVS